nr:hypothetical protein BaRGS_030762 [Batillaria attramentaria]
MVVAVVVAEVVSMLWYANNPPWGHRIGDRYLLTALLSDTGLVFMLKFVTHVDQAQELRRLQCRPCNHPHQEMCQNKGSILQVRTYWKVTSWEAALPLAAWVALMYACLEGPHVVHSVRSLSWFFFHTLHKMAVVFSILVAMAYVKALYVESAMEEGGQGSDNQDFSVSCSVMRDTPADDPLDLDTGAAVQEMLVSNPNLDPDSVMQDTPVNSPPDMDSESVMQDMPVDSPPDLDSESIMHEMSAVKNLPSVSAADAQACHGSASQAGESCDSVTDFSLVTGSPSDIILDTGDRQFLCHKSVLCTESVWFQAMFESGMKESRSDKVHLSDTDSEHFLILLKYFYTGELQLTQSNINGLTELSSMYQVSKALKLCCDFLINIIEDDLCLSLMRMANFLMLTDVYNHARRHALWHFQRVSQVEDYFLAPATQLIDYLQDQYLNIDSEVDVFKAAAAWYVTQEKPCEVTDLENFFADAVYFHLLTNKEIDEIQDLAVVRKDKELTKFAASLRQEDIMTRLKEKCRLATCSEGCLYAQRNSAPLEVLQFHPDSCSLEHFASLFDIYRTPLALDCGYRAPGSKWSIGHRLPFAIALCSGLFLPLQSIWTLLI